MKSDRKRQFGAVVFGIAVTILVWHSKEPSEADAVMAASKLAAVGGGVAGAAGTGTSGSGPRIAGCPVFPADNVWNTPIDKLQVDKHSDDYIQRMGPALVLHPNFGSEATNGIPITIIKPGRARIPMSFEYGDESDHGHYPTPEGALVEGGWNSPTDSDRHILMVDEGRCVLTEVGGVVQQKDGSWHAGAGIKMDLTSNALRAPDKTSTDAAGLAVLPGLLRYDEIAAGEIKHAIRFTTPKTQRLYVWPARHFASRITDPTYPPMGERFRLKADFDISKFSKENQIILKGLKKYGMILSDNGGSWFLIGEPDKRWNDADLARLKSIKGESFEAVDESDWQMLPDSARVDPVSLH
ncbi:MAG TPA: hypothetical protein VGB69_10480 [Edaphobacter sp.]